MMLLTHPTGNQNVRQALKAFQEDGLLMEFVTTVATFDGNLYDLLSKTKWGAEFERRRYPVELAAVTRQLPGRELGRMLSSRGGLSWFTRHEQGPFCVDAIYRNLDQFTADRVRKLADKAELSMVYGYEDGALAMFEAAKGFGLKCVYDLPIAYWKTSRKLLEEEAERLPKWKATLVGTEDSSNKLARKDRELELADIVICPSEFVRNSLSKEIGKSKPVYVIPFGSPEVVNSDNAIVGRSKANRMQILFAGSMTQRKGLADVFAAMNLLDPKKFELHVLGSPIVDLAFYKQQYSGFLYHPPCSHADVLRLMQSCDVFVLPSIVEGRALVQQEALACGLPIIVTKNAGAEDLVEDEQAGFLVPIRSPQAIAEKLELLYRERRRLAFMKIAARKKARELTWELYRQRLLSVVSDFMEG